MATTTALEKPIRTLDEATVRFCGDSGDGMQLAGSQFTNTSALVGNDIATFPDFPAEIRAPRGTLAGVSGFQIHFSSKDIYTPGDTVDALVAMNPAALATNLTDLRPGGILIVNSDTFDPKGLEQAGYKTNPVEDGSFDSIEDVFASGAHDRSREDVVVAEPCARCHARHVVDRDAIDDGINAGDAGDRSRDVRPVIALARHRSGIETVLILLVVEDLGDDDVRGHVLAGLVRLA